MVRVRYQWLRIVFASLRDADLLAYRRSPPESRKHRVPHVRSRDVPPASQVPSERGPVSAGEWSGGEPGRAEDRPIQIAGPEHVLHEREISIPLAQHGPEERRAEIPHE